MIKLRVYSDISFQLFTRELEGRIEVVEEHFGPIALSLHNREEVAKSRLPMLIHSDPIFLRHSIEEQKEILNSVLDISEQFQSVPIFLSNLTFVPPPWSTSKSIGRQFCQELQKLQIILSNRENVTFLNTEDCLNFVGQQASYHYQLGHAYQMPYRMEFVQVYVRELLSTLHSTLSPNLKKVVAVDADQTLWGGILGEDGVHQLAWNRDAQGAVYHDFQNFLLNLKNQGFLLALCSKNNEQDIIEAFDSLSMPLQLEDFSAIHANWNSKSENLQKISEELNLGLESFVFIDDSEFEIESVNAQCPSVTTLVFKESYEDFLSLTQHPAFLIRDLTDEDHNRSQFYRQEKSRQELRANLSFQQYLETLNIEVSMAHNQPQDYQRLAQLTDRTNQFNFAKRVLSVSELETFGQDGNHIFSIRVQDKFGDYGIAGLVLIEESGILQNFLLSCRVLGRGVEERVAELIARWCQNNSLNIKKIHFQESSRNQPALQFLSRAQELFLHPKTKQS